MEKLLISVSGGLTSGYMLRRLWDKYRDEFEIQAVFANTGFEHEKTLQFVKNITEKWRIPITWVEAVVNSGPIGCTHKIVDFQSASRAGEPFQEVMEKYGLCNQSYPHCNRELKLNPIHSYAKKHLGWDKGSYSTAVGIREDESKRRASHNTVKLWGIVYPLLDWFPSDKNDVADFWDDQEFTLGLEQFQGNCSMCFKKSEKKLVNVIQTDINSALRFQEIEELTKSIKPGGDRKPFRGHKTTLDMIQLAEISDPRIAFKLSDVGGGCSESCDIFTSDVE